MESMNDLTQSLDGSSGEYISQNIESFSNILNNECKPLFGKRLHINSKLTAMGGQQEWFDNDCKTKRDEFYIDLNKYRSSKRRFEARRANTDKFIDARLSKTKLYWKLLKDGSTKCRSSIDTSTLYSTLKRLITLKISFTRLTKMF